MVQAIAKKLDKFTHHTKCTKHFHNSEDKVSGGNAIGQLAGEPKPNDIRNEHRYRLTKHGRLRFNTTNAPTQHPKAINHGGMAIGPHQRIRVRQDLSIHRLGPNHFG